jgi:hypothetical protein
MVLSMAAVWVLPLTAGSRELQVREQNTGFYKDKGVLRLHVEARDEGGPMEGLERATWSLMQGDRLLRAQGISVPYRNGDFAETSVLVLLPSTANFTGADEPDVARDRSQTPLRYALEGLETLRTFLGPGDKLAIGCYDEAKADAVALSPARPAERVEMPDIDRVSSRCNFVGSGRRDTPRLQTLLLGAIKSWLAKEEPALRKVVVIVTDGNSKEAVTPEWWRAAGSSWLEIYVVALEDGGDPRNSETLAKGGVIVSAMLRQNLSDEMARLGPWINGRGIYEVTYSLQDRVQGPNVEVTLGVQPTAGSAIKSVPHALGPLERKSSWLRIVLLVAGILVGLIIVFLLVRWIASAISAGRRRREEEAARRSQETYDGPSRGRLLVRDGPVQNSTFHLVDDVTYIGRSPDNHVSIPDGSVGKRHCSIQIRDRSYQIEDLQSVNGVFVNGQKVLKAFLKDGDSIRLGSTEMQFRV